jgi:hypothetical protein
MPKHAISQSFKERWARNKFVIPCMLPKEGDLIFMRLRTLVSNSPLLFFSFSKNLFIYLTHIYISHHLSIQFTFPISLYVFNIVTSSGKKNLKLMGDFCHVF